MWTLLQGAMGRHCRGALRVKTLGGFNCVCQEVSDDKEAKFTAVHHPLISERHNVRGLTSTKELPRIKTQRDTQGKGLRRRPSRFLTWVWYAALCSQLKLDLFCVQNALAIASSSKAEASAVECKS